MKRILYFAAAALMLAACNQKEPVATPDPVQISVVKSDVIFDALGGTGKITVSAKGSVKATSASDWCQVSVSGSDINVTAAQNDGLDGRASRITLECNGESIYLTAQQTGMTYTFNNTSYLVEMAGGEVDILGESTFEVSAGAQQDWINVNEIEGGYHITIPANDSGDKRVGTFTIKCKDVETVYTFTQKFDRNFAGTYKVDFFSSSAKTTAKTADVTFRRDASDPDKYYISGFTPEGEVPIRFDAAQDMLIINNCQYIGTYGTDPLYEYICVNYATTDLASNYLGYTETAPYAIYFTYKYVGGKYTLELHDSAPMFNTARKSTGFTFYTFTTAPGTAALATANRKSTILAVIFPTMTQK